VKVFYERRWIGSWATSGVPALVAADEGTLISFQVRPVAQSGTSPGLAVSSAEVGPVTPAPDARQTASDLELISLKATPELLTVNGQLTYTITVRNNGPAAATGVHVIDALPPRATPVPAGGLPVPARAGARVRLRWMRSRDACRQC